MDRAEELVDELIDAADSDSREVIFAHRVLGHLAAARDDPADLEAEYDTALSLNEVYTEAKPTTDRRWTRSRGRTDCSVRTQARCGTTTKRLSVQQFCGLAKRWLETDLRYVQRLQGHHRVSEQLRRIKVEDVNELEGLCP